MSPPKGLGGEARSEEGGLAREWLEVVWADLLLCLDQYILKQAFVELAQS